MQPAYWLDLFTYETWTEFRAAGAQVTGFRENRWKSIQKIKAGDLLLCYLTGVSRWIGLLEVTGLPFKSSEPIWKANSFPARVPVKELIALEPLTAIPVIEMGDKLTIFNDLKSPHAWTGHFRASPTLWAVEDGKAVVAALKDAQRSPIERPFELAKLNKVPPILKASPGGAVTIPEDDETEAEPEVSKTSYSKLQANGAQKEISAHTEIQWLLLKLGSDMGLDVWVAKNDLHHFFNGQKFSSIPKLKKSLPLQFDEATSKTIELIDVLWLKGNSIQAAFEIESTTTIFSGLLRMSDLITMQPNINIPLYIVAPSERRSKVIQEVNRPTFARLRPPMSETCRFISFEEIKKQVDLAKSLLKFLKPEFLNSFSESCEIEEV